MTDTLRFLDAVAGLPEQLVAAHEAAYECDLAALPAADEIANVVVLGMGGSGIAGDVVAAAAGPEVGVPIVVSKGYECPSFVGARSLVFAVSYSGETEETLAATRDALSAGASVVAVSVGGALAAIVTAGGGIHLPCPDGYMPRAALGALIAPIFVTLQRSGVWAGARDALGAAETQLAKRRDLCVPAVTGAANPARELARKIDRTVPLMYGGGTLGATAAYRWKCDVGENAKAPAFWNTYPELDHNEICGWGQHGDVTRQVISLVELRHSFEHPQVARRVAITREIIREAVHQVLEVSAEGDGRLAQLLDLMYLGDWVSCYLALQNDVDPGPIPAIADLKRALSDDQ